MSIILLYPCICSSYISVRVIFLSVFCPHPRYAEAKLLWEELEEAAIDTEELDNLFCKPVDVNKKTTKAKPKSPVKQVGHH